MLYKTMLLLSLFSLLGARENPFIPVDATSPLSYTTNEIKRYEPFKKSTIKLPNSARVLESVTIKYKNLDGSITEKEVKIKKSVDWHYPITVSQNIKTSTKLTNKTKTHKTKNRFKKIADIKFISFYAYNKILKIKTKDKLLRDFILIKPDRVILDFKRDADFRSFKYNGTKIFKTLRIGNHSGYYRVVIELDGKYIYTIKKTSYGYKLILE